MKNKIWKFFKFFILVALIYFIGSKIDYAKISNYTSVDKYPYYLIFLFLLVIIHTINSYKYQLIFKELEAKVPILELIIVNWKGVFINNFVPTGVGGDTYRYISLKNYFKNKETILVTTLLIDKVISLGTIAFLSILFGWSLFSELLKTTKLPFELILSMLIIGIASISLIVIFRKIIYSYLKSKLKIISEFIESFKKITVKMVFIISIFQLLVLFITIHAYQILFYSMDITSIPILNYFKYIPIITIGELLPISINAIGVREGLSIYLFGLQNIGPEPILIHCLIGRALGIIFSLIGALFYFK